MFSYSSVLAFALLSFQLINARSIERTPTIPRGSSQKLTAIKSPADISKREQAFVPRTTCDHHYVDQSAALVGGKIRVATTSMEYKLPTVNLEDIESSLIDVQCFDSTISLAFAEPESFNAARESWANVSQFMAISSHVGCNENGERAPYLVSGVKSHTDKLTVTLTAQRVPWKGSYETMKVKFGLSNGYDSSSLRIHEGLRRRQVSTTSTTSAAAATGSASLNNTLHANFNYQVPAEQEIFAINNQIGSTTDSATVKCKDCSVFGTIDIVEGEITVSNSTTDIGKAIDFIHDGYFRAVATNMSATVEIDATLDLSTTQSFNKTFPSIGLPGFEIPGIATIGPFFKPIIQGSLKADGQVDFTYGFEAKVPDNSTVLLNVGNVTQSSSSGFTNAQISQIPLSASSPDISVTATLGFRGELDLGINILSDEGTMSAGMFFDLPTLTVSISELADADANCNTATNLTSITGVTFSSLTNIQAKAGVDVGGQVVAAIDIPGLSTSIGTATTFFATTFSLPTACLSFDAAAKTFASPTATVSAQITDGAKGAGNGTATASAGAAGNTSAPAKASANSGTRIVGNPITGDGAVWWTGGMLLSVFLVALTL